MQNVNYKRGWIEIVEAFVSILLVAGVVLIILNQSYLSKSDISEKVYNVEVSILREIQTNDHFREEISNAPEPLPIEWEEDERFPQDVKDKIIERTPDYLTCIGKICNLTETCSLRETEELKEQIKDKDIYAQAVSISSTLGGVYYRQLNMFCWAR